MIPASKIRDIIGQCNSNGLKPTCEEIAGVLAGQTYLPIDISDIQDTLDTMVNAGVISDEGGRYFTNPNSPL